MSRRLVVIRWVLILITVTTGWAIGRQFNSVTWVCGNSMAPLVHAGELLRFSRTMPAEIERGAIVLVVRPGQPRMIKRVIGLPQETISFDRGEVFVNGHMLYEPYLVQSVTTYCWERSNLTAGADEYVLLGDQRLISEDSRHYGPIPRSQIIGIVAIDCAAPQMLQEPHYRISLKNEPVKAANSFGSQGAATNYDSL